MILTHSDAFGNSPLACLRRCGVPSLR